MNTVTIVIVVVLFLAAFVAVMYNHLVRLTNQAKEAWSDIAVQMKRRYDLIPNLVETVKGYAAHEASVLEEVVKARSAAMGAMNSTPAAQVAAEGQLSGTLKSLFALSEAYPDLKANQNFAQLQQELGDTEDKIQAARRFYNGTVRDLNTALQTFPSNLVAMSFSKFQPMELFELAAAEAAATEPVKVQF